MHLPDDVALKISDHDGTYLKLLYSLWGDWLEAIGDDAVMRLEIALSFRL
ncbi:MAG: hypothetical protein ACLQUZ_17200 [Rhizomicrobium sp.]